MLSHFAFLAEAAGHETHPAAAHAEGHGPIGDIIQIFGNFGVDGPHLIVQLVNFSLLAFVLYRWAIKPALGKLEERNLIIEKGLADAKAAEQKLAEAQKSAEAVLNQASEQATKILFEARNVAKQTVEAAKGEAAAAVAELQRKAQEALEVDRRKMLNEVRAEVSRLVVETAVKVLDQNLDDAQRARLNEAAVKQLANR
jgi:F-type H+-transporting ATPase subunit b